MFCGTKQGVIPGWSEQGSPVLWAEAQATVRMTPLVVCRGAAAGGKVSGGGAIGRPGE